MRKLQPPSLEKLKKAQLLAIQVTEFIEKIAKNDDSETQTLVIFMLSGAIKLSTFGNLVTDCCEPAVMDFLLKLEG